MTRSAPSTLYDDDFFAWTQEQAEALRRLARADAVHGVEAVHGVDVEHLAEEIEDLGKRDLREVRSLLTKLIVHLVKIAACSSSRDIPHWRAEARSFGDAACQAFAPSMRHLLDIEAIWHKGEREARLYLQDIGLPPAARRDCPFGLDDVLTDALDVDRLLAKLASKSGA